MHFISSLASMLYSLWVILISSWLTFKYSMLVFWGIRFANFGREEIDEVIRKWANSVLEVIHLDLKIYNESDFHFKDGKPYIIMSNHTSLYDIPLNFAALPGSIRMLAKKELFKIPIFGLILRTCEFILIDRQNHENAMKNMEYARKKLDSGIILWIAPEGTRSRTGKLLPFKKGGFHLAIETGAIVVPVSIRKIREVMKADSLRIIPGKTVEFHVGEPIDASQYGSDQKNKLISAVRTQIGHLSGQEI